MNKGQIKRTEINADALARRVAVLRGQIATATFAARPSLQAQLVKAQRALAVSAAR